MDTLNLSLDHNSYDYDNIINICKKDFIKSRPSFMNQDSGLITSSYDYKDNVHLTVNEAYLNISFSVSKFYNGNNIQNIGFYEIVVVLDKLSKLLNTDLRIAKIKRLDLAFNVLMNHYVYSYLKSIEEPEKLFRKDTNSKGDTVSLIRGGKYDREVHSFYDKFKQSNRNQKKDSNLFGESKNMLRFETRLEGKLLVEKFGDLIVDDLYNKQTYQCLMEWWFKSYKSIPKSKEPQLSVLELSTPTKFFVWLANEGARSLGGKHKLLSMVKGSIVEAKRKYPIRKRIHREISNVSYIDADLMLELDDKMEAIYIAEISSLSLNEIAA